MKLARQIKPLSYLESHAPEIIRGLEETHEPLILTQDGEAKAVLQDIASYEETQEALALLKVLALTSRTVENGRVVPATEAFARIRGRFNL